MLNKIVPCPYNLKPNNIKIKNLLGLVVHAASEFVNKEGLKYNKNYNKQNNTFKNINFNDIDEWIHITEFLYMTDVSANSFIYEDGALMIAKKFNEKTYHAGISKFDEITNLNNSFAGVELIMSGRNTYDQFLNKLKTGEWLSEKHYETLNYLIERIEEEDKNQDFKYIIGHNECSGDDVRGKGKGKKDPGLGFDWSKVKWHGRKI